MGSGAHFVFFSKKRGLLEWFFEKGVFGKKCLDFFPEKKLGKVFRKNTLVAQPGICTIWLPTSISDAKEKKNGVKFTACSRIFLSKTPFFRLGSLPSLWKLHHSGFLPGYNAAAGPWSVDVSRFVSVYLSCIPTWRDLTRLRTVVWLKLLHYWTWVLTHVHIQATTTRGGARSSRARTQPCCPTRSPLIPALATSDVSGAIGMYLHRFLANRSMWKLVR